MKRTFMGSQDKQCNKTQAIKEFYIINLASSLDRKEQMQYNIEKFYTINPHCKETIHFHFFQALTPKDIKESGFINRYERFWAGVWKAREVCETELACFASHYALWEKCVALNKPLCVLEDDIDFSPCFLYKPDMLNDIYASSYEYVRLYFLTFHKMLLIEEHFALAHRLMLGTQGYYITPHAAKKLITHAKRIYLAVDYYMSHSYLHGVIEMVYLPTLIETNAFDANSNIGKPEHQPKDKKFYRKFVVLRELHRIYRQIRMLIFAIFAVRKVCRLSKRF